MQSFISGMVFIEVVLNLILFFLGYKLEGIRFGGEKISTFLIDAAAMMTKVRVFIVFKRTTGRSHIRKRRP